jgi:hypothetical protein
MSMQPTQPSSSPLTLLALLTTPAPLVLLGLILTLGSGTLMVRYVSGLEGPATPDGRLVAGDFMAFYTGGRLIVDGDGSQLYDLKAQHALQAELKGTADGPWQPFVNPPLLAVALAGISQLPFVHGLYLFDLAMVAALVGTFALLRPVVPALASHRGRWWATILLVCAFHPLIRTALGGQNTALTLMLMAGAYAGVKQGRAVLGGVCLGVLTYKPQFALLTGLALLVARQYRLIGIGATLGLAHYVCGAWWCGFDWPLRMLDALAVYQPMEREASYYTHVALLPACDFALRGPWSTLLPAFLIPIVSIVVLSTVRRCPTRDPRFGVVWSGVVCATIIISPHLQFYDLGVLVLPVLLTIDGCLRAGRPISNVARLGLACGYFGFPIYAHAQEWGWQPLVLWPVILLVWTAWQFVEMSSPDSVSHSSAIADPMAGQARSA